MESIWNADVVWRYERDLAFLISLMVWTCILTAVCPSSKERKSGIKPLNFQTKDLGWFSGLIKISICECSIKTAKAQGVQCVLARALRKSKQVFIYLGVNKYALLKNSPVRTELGALCGRLGVSVLVFWGLVRLGWSLLAWEQPASRAG